MDAMPTLSTLPDCLATVTAKSLHVTWVMRGSVYTRRAQPMAFITRARFRACPSLASTALQMSRLGVACSQQRAAQSVDLRHLHH